ncbi:protein of unknown function [Streptococcus thermophilus]|nr:protein of unknown function [Streptococcus thermophilus]CAD0150632.1 protein of unknown function [Streptococcus thermophilus]
MDILIYMFQRDIIALKKDNHIYLLKSNVIVSAKS